ncbi:hypothetical protein Plec18167_001392 [Paecilomyces lecythidis]|uniref:cyclin-dependent kinase n=1 Tax=Paecilomyces lecythidis TaxID=3004212 RepID=A0ABR3YC57_9EURO
MSAAGKSRWAEDDPETEAAIAQRKREKEEKKRAKAEKQRKLAEAQTQQQAATSAGLQSGDGEVNGEAGGRPAKRRRLSDDTGRPTGEEATDATTQQKRSTLLRFPAPEWGPCRHVDNFERLNHIEEGSYGWVSRAKDITTGEIVALKKLKMENSPDGFPVTGLREIQTLLGARHQNIVTLREIVMGNSMDK